MERKVKNAWTVHKTETFDSANPFHWERKDMFQSLTSHLTYLSSSVPPVEEKETVAGADASLFSTDSSTTTSSSSSGCDANKSSTVQAVWRKYTSSTTLHGLSNTQAARDRLVGHRICWGILVLLMLGFTSYNLISLLVSYQEHPYTSVWDLQRSQTMDFPTITICPENTINFNKTNKSDEVWRFYTDANWWMNTDHNASSSTEITNMTYSELYRKYGFTLDDFVVNASIQYGKNFYDLNATMTLYVQDATSCVIMNDFTLDLEYRDILSKNHRMIFSIDLRRPEIGPDSTSRGLYLFIHKRGTWPFGMDSMFIAPGFSYHVLFSQTEYHFLPLPYQSYGKEGCLDTSDGSFTNPLLHFPVYSRMNCLAELIEGMSASLCGCVHKEYVSVYKRPECTISQWFNCLHPISNEVMTNAVNTTTDILNGKCPNACTEYVMEMSSSQMHFDQNLRPESPHAQADQDFLRLVVKPKTTDREIVKHEPAMTALGITSTVGGFMGLFMGASLLTVVEFVEMCGMLVRCFLCPKAC